MKLLPTLTALTTLLLAANAAIANSSQEYRLKTDLKPGQAGKQRFAGLYLESYHTGAGLDDGVMVAKKSAGIKGFLNGTNGHAGGVTYQNQVFDLGNPFPWTMVMAIDVTFYSGWQPVEVNAGSGPSNPNGDSGFWINGTGLQWTSALTEGPVSVDNAFGGWLVCDWWHGGVQLFFRLSSYNYTAPCSCADVYLCPEYI